MEQAFRCPIAIEDTLESTWLQIATSKLVWGYRVGGEPINDPLQDVLGLGAKKMQTLLRHFGGRKGVEHASIKDLQTVPGIGNSLAERIFKAINP